MLTLGVRYLTGSAVASHVDNRSHVEWPPHPGRIFMALAAAHFQTGEDPAERAALEWLEQQNPPQIKAPFFSERPSVTQFVPVNDVAGPATAPMQTAQGLCRKRQPREFAKAWIGDEPLFLHWPNVEPGQHFHPLETLCGKVTRIGHSTSLVQMWASLQGMHPPANWLPDETRVAEVLRIANRGTLQHLEAQFNRHQVDYYFDLSAAAADTTDKKRQKEAKRELKDKFEGQAPQRLRPELSISQGYSSSWQAKAITPAGTVFDPRLLMFAIRREDGPFRHLDLSATLQVSGRFRESLLSHLGTDIPEVLSGHFGNKPSDRPHVSIFPLPFVGREHAHGGILGLAVAVPRETADKDRQRLLDSLAMLAREGLKLGALGKWRLETASGADWRETLRGRTWTAHPDGARRWATVTPYVFDRHPKAKDRHGYEMELATGIRQSWERISQCQTEPIEVVVTPVSAHDGAPAARDFPRLRRKDGSECRQTHAILVFREPITGPVLLGAGRFRGYGLCRPLLSYEGVA